MDRLVAQLWYTLDRYVTSLGRTHSKQCGPASYVPPMLTFFPDADFQK